MYSGRLAARLLAFVVITAAVAIGLDRTANPVAGRVTSMAAAVAGTPTIGSLTDGSGAVTPGGYVSLYARNVVESGSGTIAGVRFFRESNGSSGLQIGSDAYVGVGVYAGGMWSLKAITTGLSGPQTYYAVAYDTAGSASSPASVAASVSGTGFANWSILQPFLAKVPQSVGYIASTSVVNFGTTIYTGSLDTTITLDRIREDNGPNRSGDGASFTNNGNPPHPTNRGSFYEFTVNPQTGCTPNWSTSQIAFPGPIRFMIDTSGDVYFTGDHYATDLNLYISGTPSVGSVAANPSTATAGTAVTLTASNVSETIAPTPNLNANTGSNVMATVTNVQFFLESNGTSGLQTDTDRLLGSGTQNGSTWTLSNVSMTGLAAGTYTVYAVGFDPAGNTATQTGTLTITAATSKARADFDGDGKTDVSVFRPSEGSWYVNGSTAGFSAVHWGGSGDTLIPGDYDGDGKADWAIFRPSDTPGVSDFYVLNSNGFTLSGYSHGSTGDIAVPGDYDGDGKADIVVWRPSTGTWWMWLTTTQTTTGIQFGSPGDVPFAMDNDGDGKANLAVFRPSTNTWYIARPTGIPSQNFDAVPWGTTGDILVPADYDGDGKEDVAVFRPSTGVWYIRQSSNGALNAVQFGASGDIPVPGDYDGDGKSDVAVYRGGIWYLNRSTDGFAAVSFGVDTDTPVLAAYHP
jgi:hypothetical protein